MHMSSIGFFAPQIAAVADALGSTLVHVYGDHPPNAGIVEPVRLYMLRTKAGRHVPAFFKVGNLDGWLQIGPKHTRLARAFVRAKEGPWPRDAHGYLLVDPVGVRAIVRWVREQLTDADRFPHLY